MVLVFTLHRKDDVEDGGSLKVLPGVQQEDGLGLLSQTHHSSGTKAGNHHDLPDRGDNILNSVTTEDSDVD